MSAHEQITGATKDHAIGGPLVKTFPGAAVVIADLVGVSLPLVVYILTALFISVQIGYFVWEWRKEYRANEIEDRRKENHGHNPERRKRK